MAPSSFAGLCAGALGPAPSAAAVGNPDISVIGQPSAVPGTASPSSSLVLKHGGDVWVTSEPGLGSPFWFTLKLDLSAKPPRG